MSYSFNVSGLNLSELLLQGWSNPRAPPAVQFYTESPITDSSAASNSREWTLD